VRQKLLCAGVRTNGSKKEEGKTKGVEAIEKVEQLGGGRVAVLCGERFIIFPWVRPTNHFKKQNHRLVKPKNRHWASAGQREGVGQKKERVLV